MSSSVSALSRISTLMRCPSCWRSSGALDAEQRDTSASAITSPSSAPTQPIAVWRSPAIACGCFEASEDRVDELLADPRDRARQQARDQAAEREPDRQRAVRRPHEPDRALGVLEHAEIAAPDRSSRLAASSDRPCAGSPPRPSAPYGAAAYPPPPPPPTPPPPPPPAATTTAAAPPLLISALLWRSS